MRPPPPPPPPSTSRRYDHILMEEERAIEVAKAEKEGWLSEWTAVIAPLQAEMIQKQIKAKIEAKKKEDEKAKGKQGP